MPAGRTSPRSQPVDPGASIVAAWRTNNRVTIELVRRLPPRAWDLADPAQPRRTLRSIVAHVHNARCSWVRTLGREHGIAVPERVDPNRVGRRDLALALRRSGEGIEALLTLGLDAGGAVPPSKASVWRNLALDVAHVLTYFVAHEAHHRGQVVMLARQCGHRLPVSTTGRLWWWKDLPRGGRSR